ncbi:hypothetical protein V5P93_005534 [Actinokineospora auranticolor]|uniref:DUF7919 domain-containing protein n=1 Tax=Actinokineospora auranticolor TaxID=155976 RepID=A0A2S6GQH8_9PSEU|nr:hypothetical protein [Actinokineospora auranticolor]PPK67433.1 hypothetical protein CLV40_10796 [Actinokineospora auranticolor]
MTRYEDLTPYEYSKLRPPWRAAVNIGWLEPDAPYAVGPVEDGVVDMLVRLSHTHIANVTRGIYRCRFCGAFKLSLNVPEISGASTLLGHAEIHFKGHDGTVYAAPSLIAHYVAEHDYSPPRQFIEAAWEVDRSTPRVRHSRGVPVNG